MIPGLLPSIDWKPASKEVYNLGTTPEDSQQAPLPPLACQPSPSASAETSTALSFLSHEGRPEATLDSASEKLGPPSPTKQDQSDEDSFSGIGILRDALSSPRSQIDGPRDASSSLHVKPSVPGTPQEQCFLGSSREQSIEIADSTDTEQQPTSEAVGYRESGLASSSFSKEKRKLKGGSVAADRQRKRQQTNQLSGDTAVLPHLLQEMEEDYRDGRKERLSSLGVARNKWDGLRRNVIEW